MGQYRALFLVVTVVAALFVASPALRRLQTLATPQTTFFTELSILGSYRNATYPRNIAVGENCSLYLDVTNRLGYCAYYLIQVKFRNETQSAPDSFNHTSSNQPSLGNFSFFVADEGTFELPINVSFHYKVDENINDRLDMQNILVNGVALSANSTTIAWDSGRQGYYGNLFFELWIFNDTANAFQYHQRYVSMWLNMSA